MKNEYPTEGKVIRSVLGAVIGDICGSTREGYRHNVKRDGFKILTTQSSVTDDTVLTIALIDYLLHQDSLTVADALASWAGRYPHAGFGGAFKTFCLTREAQPSEGNGTAMRVSPIALRAKSLDEALSQAAMTAAVTHTSDASRIGAQATAAAIFMVRQGLQEGKDPQTIKDEIKTYVEMTFGYDLSRSVEEVKQQSLKYAAMKEQSRTTGVKSPDYINMSNSKLSVPMAFIAFLNGDSYEECLRYAMLMGGDSDSLGAIAGSISAQLYGIPESLVNEALTYLPNEMINLINAFEGTKYPLNHVTPPNITRLTEHLCVVYGSDEGGNDHEDGHFEVIGSRMNHHPKKGYPIPTVGKTLDEVSDGVKAFIAHAKANPDITFHVRKVGYDKAGFPVGDIAPLFQEALNQPNILLPEEIYHQING